MTEGWSRNKRDAIERAAKRGGHLDLPAKIVLVGLVILVGVPLLLLWVGLLIRLYGWLF